MRVGGEVARGDDEVLNQRLALKGGNGGEEKGREHERNYTPARTANRGPFPLAHLGRGMRVQLQDDQSLTESGVEGAFGFGH